MCIRDSIIIIIISLSTNHGVTHNSNILVLHSSLFLSLVLTGLFQVHNVKSARDSGELQIDSLKEEVEQMRVWKDKVRHVVSSVTLLCLIAVILSVVFFKYFNRKNTNLLGVCTSVKKISDPTSQLGKWG